MDFNWSSEQNELYENVLKFAREHLNATVLERDAEHRFGEEEWKECGAFGLPGSCVMPSSSRNARSTKAKSHAGALPVEPVMHVYNGQQARRR